MKYRVLLVVRDAYMHVCVAHMYMEQQRESRISTLNGAPPTCVQFTERNETFSI